MQGEATKERDVWTDWYGKIESLCLEIQDHGHQCPCGEICAHCRIVLLAGETLERVIDELSECTKATVLCMTGGTEP